MSDRAIFRGARNRSRGCADVPETVIVFFRFTIIVMSVGVCIHHPYDALIQNVSTFNSTVVPLIPVLIPLAIDRDLLVKRTSPDG